MQTITLNGVEYIISMTMRASIKYEQMTKRNVFDLNQFTSGLMEPVVQLGYAMIYGANRDKEVLSYDDLLNCLDDVDTMSAFIQTVTKVMMDYFHLEPGDQPDEDKTKAAKKKGTKSKNL